MELNIDKKNESHEDETLKEAIKKEKRSFSDLVIWLVVSLITALCNFIFTDFDPMIIPNSFWIALKGFWFGFFMLTIVLYLPTWIFAKLKVKKIQENK